MKPLISFLAVLTAFFFKVNAQTLPKEVISPDGNTVISVFLSEKNKRMEYSVSYKNKPVILKSVLGISFNGDDWLKDVKLKTFSETAKDTTWEPVYGERSIIRDHYNGATFSFVKEIRYKKETGEEEIKTKDLDLEVRVYNEGVAFRYVFPEKKEGGPVLHITGETTEFTLPKKTMAWYAPGAQSGYELLAVKDFPGKSERPLTLELPNGLYASITEAQVVEYCRSLLETVKKKPNTLKFKMYGKVDEIAPFATPWRVVMVADKPGKLLENNDIILNLNDPCAIKNTSWIKPGKVIREITLTTGGAKACVDFAASHGLQYVEFDAGWYGYEYHKSSDATTITLDPRRSKGPLELQKIINYAGKKDIGIIVYVNQRALQKQLDELLPLLQSWGVKGIKFGFVHVGSYRWTTWMHEAVKRCADYHLMVDIHDNYRPTGFSRTYPNLLTQEGIRGNEEFPDATHNTVLPFTRYIAGAADYTICYYYQDFEKKHRDENGVPVGRYLKTTSAHQLALSVIFYSPFQFLFWYDKPSDIQNEPELEFFKEEHTVWDDTKVLQGIPGKYVSVARRSGDDWFVGTITNNDARDMKVSFDFLPEGKKYRATVYYDDPTAATRTKVGIKHLEVDSSTVMDVKLLPSGGQAVWLKPL